MSQSEEQLSSFLPFNHLANELTASLSYWSPKEDEAYVEQSQDMQI